MIVHWSAVCYSLIQINPFNAGTDFRRKNMTIMTSMVYTSTGTTKTILMAVEPLHVYANEAERANWDI